jgi:hypothetical protein
MTVLRTYLAAAVGAIALGGVLAVPAGAAGVTPETLSAAGWSCFQAPVGPPGVICANPGLGRPIPGDPDPPPQYTLVRFDLDGTYDAKVHFIRADLYAGQPCGPSGAPYLLSPRIGYFECVRTWPRT